MTETQVSRRNFLKKAIPVVAGVGLAGALGIDRTFGALTTTTSTNNGGVTTTPGRPLGSASYIIYQDGSTIIAQNCRTGQDEFKGQDAATVIQNAIDGLPAQGGKIFLRAGTYNITSTIMLKDYVELEGENIGYVYPDGGTIFRAGANVNLVSLIGTVSQHRLMPSIKNIYFDGTGCTGDAIHYEHVSVAIVRDVYIINFNGSAIYLDSVFTGAFSNIKIDTCGSSTNPAWVLTGSEGCSSIMIEQVDNSLFQTAGLFVGPLCAEIVVSDYFGDGLDTNPFPALEIHGNRVSLSNVHCRGVGTDCSMISISGDRIQLNNLHVEGRGRLLVTEVNAGSVVLGSTFFAGESSANMAQVAIECRGGTISIGAIQFENVIARAITKGIIGTWDSTQSVGIETVSYGLIEAANVSAPLNLANTGAVMPVFVSRIVTIDTIKIRVASQSGNIDVGIYDAAGNRIVSTGSIPTPAAGFAFVSIPRTTLFHGLHYFALASDNATAAFYKTAAIALGSKKAFISETLFPLPVTLPSISESGDGRFWMEAV